MRASISQIQASFRSVANCLRELELLYDVNETTVLRLSKNETRITWSSPNIRPSLTEFSDSTIGEYLRALKGRHFNFQLTDGALIQFSYDVHRRDHITAGRAVWFPCPAIFSLDDLEIATIEELVLTTPTEHLACRAPLRIDHAPSLASEDHPVTHMHAGMEDFRLPIQRALEPSRFLRLILRTAYPRYWRARAELITCENWGGTDGLTHEDRAVGYLGWNVGVECPAVI